VTTAQSPYNLSAELAMREIRFIAGTNIPRTSLSCDHPSLEIYSVWLEWHGDFKTLCDGHAEGYSWEKIHAALGSLVDRLRPIIQETMQSIPGKNSREALHPMWRYLLEGQQSLIEPLERARDEYAAAITWRAENKTVTKLEAYRLRTKKGNKESAKNPYFLFWADLSLLETKANRKFIDYLRQAVQLAA